MTITGWAVDRRPEAPEPPIAAPSGVPAVALPRQDRPRPVLRRSGILRFRVVRAVVLVVSGIRSGIRTVVQPATNPDARYNTSPVLMRGILLAVIALILVHIVAPAEAWAPPRRRTEGLWGTMDAAVPDAPAEPIVTAAWAADDGMIQPEEEGPRRFLQEGPGSQEQEDLKEQQEENASEEQQERPVQQQQEPQQHQQLRHSAGSTVTTTSSDTLSSGQGGMAEWEATFAPSSAVQLGVGVTSPALFAGQAGAASLEMMPDTEEQVAMLPNCMFYASYPGTCIPETAHSPCR